MRLGWGGSLAGAGRARAFDPTRQEQATAQRPTANTSSPMWNIPDRRRTAASRIGSDSANVMVIKGFLVGILLRANAIARVTLAGAGRRWQH